LSSNVLRDEICKHLKWPDLQKDQIVCCVAGGIVLDPDLQMWNAYNAYKSEDGFLYATFEIHDTPALAEAPAQLVTPPTSEAACVNSTIPGSSSSRDKSSELTKYEVGDSDVKQMLLKHPDRIPVLCEQAQRSGLPDMESIKLLVPRTMPCGELKYIIHKRVVSTNSIASDQTIYLFVKNTTPKTSTLLSNMYEQHKASDGFLHVTFSAENTLGQRSVVSGTGFVVVTRRA